MSPLSLSGRALLPAGHFAAVTLDIAQGRIERVRPQLDPLADIVAEGWIVPGFIDLQLNGAYGFDFTADGRAVARVAARLPETGVTGFLPTVITSPLETYPARLAEIAEANEIAEGARVLGVHLEGPFFHPAQRGAHNPALLRPIDRHVIQHWADHPLVRMVTLAPELPGALEAIRLWRARHIGVSAGHSQATYAEAQAAFEAGLGWGTHLFNAMRPMHHREPGLSGALLASSVPCGLIVDGLHVHPAMVTLAYHAKGAAGLTLVTDAMAAMGMPPGQYVLGDRAVSVDAGSARLSDGTLAGSLLTMDAAVRNMQTFTGCSLAEAVTMATLTPAQVLGHADMGRLAPGCQADIVLLDDALHVELTLVGGQVVFERAPMR
jgi:N-acetylglucosamine-6-phosphate deacetylase